MRKALTYGVFFIACGTSIATVDGAYVIKLKNGNEYVTTRYWHEGAQVFFDTYGGVFGVDKTFVRNIEKSDRTAPLLIEASLKPTPAEASAQQATESSANRELGSQDSNVTELKPKPAVPAPKEPLKKDEEVLKQYRELQNRFGQLNDLPKHEVYALDADIGSLREKLSNSDLAEAHKDEIEAMRTLQRAIDRYLKAAYP